MKQNKLARMIGLAIIAILIVIAGGFLLTQKTPNGTAGNQPQEVKDEFTGTWRGDGTTKDNYTWFVVYTFKNGTYNMTTDSSMKDHGTYVIAKRFEDKSIQMTKTSVDFNRTYDVFNSFADNGNTLIIDGMKLHRVK